MKNRKLTKTDKTFLEMIDRENYDIFECINDDPLYATRKDIKDKTCPYCKKQGILYEDKK